MRNKTPITIIQKQSSITTGSNDSNNQSQQQQQQQEPTDEMKRNYKTDYSDMLPQDSDLSNDKFEKSQENDENVVNITDKYDVKEAETTTPSTKKTMMMMMSNKKKIKIQQQNMTKILLKT